MVELNEVEVDVEVEVEVDVEVGRDGKEGISIFVELTIDDTELEFNPDAAKAASGVVGTPAKLPIEFASGNVGGCGIGGRDGNSKF